MHQLRYSQACDLSSLQLLMTPNARQETCKEAVKTFVVNMNRIHLGLLIPAHSFNIGDITRRSLDKAMRQTFGTNDPSEEQMQLNRKTVLCKYNELFKEESSKGTPQERIEVLKVCLLNFEKILAYNNLEVHSAVEALLQNAIIQSWTAFEVFVEDLHTYVRTGHKEYFTDQILSEKYRFLTRPALRKSYDVAFGNNSKISAALGARCIDELSVLRNLLVHCCGIVDQRFLNECKEATTFPFSTKETIVNLNSWATLPVSHKFAFDGSLFQSTVNSLIVVVHNLTTAVDEWLNKKKHK